MAAGLQLHQKRWQLDCNYTKRGGSWTAITPKEVAAGLQLHQKRWQLDCNYTKRSGSWTTMTPNRVAAGLQLHQKRWQLDCNYTQKCGSWTAITPKALAAGLQSSCQFFGAIIYSYLQSFLDYVYTSQKHRRQLLKNTNVGITSECIEQYEQSEIMANHGPLCMRTKMIKKTSSNQPCGRDSECKMVLQYM